MNPASSLGTTLEGLRAQWTTSLRLRMGAWLVVSILAAYMMDRAIEHIDALQQQVLGHDDEIARLRALAAQREWPARATEAEQLTAALQSMAWSEPSLGLTEAALQDWLRKVASGLGLKTLALSMVRVEEPAKEAAARRPDVVPERTGSKQGLAVPAGFVVLRARISFELQRAPLMAFLSECARSEHSVVVERLVLRASSQPPMAEIDVRVLARKPEGER